jgi:Rps23 Pro-64 3,4-dihydroxylase Tpa1-like proline 4-hydroxylase
LKVDRFSMAAVIAEKLQKSDVKFHQPGKVSAFAVDDLLPEEWALRIHSSFPEQGRMKLKNTIRERKHIAAQMDQFDPILEEAVFAFQQPEVVSAIAKITGIESLEPDAELYAGGISSMVKGSYLKPHLDNSHDADQQRFRALNLLYYVTPDWKPEYGGSLELWDTGPTGKPRAFPCLFNRLVVMATNRTSWHSVNEITADKRRCCVSNYFFSKVPVEEEAYFHATSFRGRPGELLGDLIMRGDAMLRTAILKTTGTLLFKNPHRYKRD